MIVGVLSVELFIPACQSLKEKRMVLRSIKDKSRKKFNVSVAEVDFQDKWQRALLAFAVVSGSRGKAEEMLTNIFRVLDEDYSVEITRYEYEYK